MIILCIPFVLSLRNWKNIHGDVFVSLSLVGPRFSIQICMYLSFSPESEPDEGSFVPASRAIDRHLCLHFSTTSHHNPFNELYSSSINSWTHAFYSTFSELKALCGKHKNHFSIHWIFILLEHSQSFDDTFPTLIHPADKKLELIPWNGNEYTKQLQGELSRYYRRQYSRSQVI